MVRYTVPGVLTTRSLRRVNASVQSGHGKRLGGLGFGCLESVFSGRKTYSRWSRHCAARLTSTCHGFVRFWRRCTAG